MYDDISLCNCRGYGLYMGHILSLFTYLLTTSISGRVPDTRRVNTTGIHTTALLVTVNLAAVNQRAWTPVVEK